MPLEGRVVVITGAARGMGRAYARGFLAEGARVVALDRSWEPTGVSGGRDDSFRRELEDRDDALVVTADITDSAQLDSACEAAISRFGTVDALINNAAMRQRDLFRRDRATTIMDMTDSDFERMFAVNFFGQLKVTRTFVRPMIEQQRGSIVSVVSPAIMTTATGGAYMAARTPAQPYHSSKSALANLMFTLAEEMNLVPGGQLGH